ncbi:glycerophosphoryl diester phosphodiesterase [Ktedonobacteria bacterium brp13]|nr:glycerophosphoryl diester phosphodiesterase [Ktedonobacteria bacterium brp13]
MSTQHSFFPALKKPYAFAHQGGELLAPTNTLVAFENALAIGCSDFLDIDVHMTKDGHLVSIHDTTVDRTTNGQGRVDSFTLSELQKLDAGYTFCDLEGNYRYRGQGIYIPTLEEVFSNYSSQIYLHFEIKDIYPKGGPSQIEEKLWTLIQKYHMERKTIVASFNQEIVDRFKKLSQGLVATGAGRAEIAQFTLAHKLGLPKFYRHRSTALEIPTTSTGFNLKDRKLINGAHRLGIDVHYWTIDAKAEMRELIELGADGIFTNRPDLLKELLLEMHLR